MRYHKNPLLLFWMLFTSLILRGELQHRTIDPQSERILEILLSDNTVLDNALIAYPVDNQWMLPLGRLSEDLGLAITVSAALSTAEGFVLEESNYFKLDAKTCSLRFQKKDTEEDCNNIVVFQDDIYVTLSLIEKWFPVRLSVRSLQSQILVYPQAKLPIQLRKERERLADRSKGLLSEFDPGFPRVKTPYSILGGPFIEEQLGATSKFGQISSSTAFSHLSQVSGEVGGLEGYGFLTGNSQQINDWRVTFSRRSIEGQFIGPMTLHEAQFFDVAIPGIPLISQTSLGRGFFFSSYPLDTPTTYDRQDFGGGLLPGWEVNLYRNEVLLERQVSEQGGRYLFKSIPLLYGKNIFRLAFFGPQGQRKDEYRVFNVGPDLLKPGTRDYRFGLIQKPDNTQRFSVQYAENFRRFFTLQTGALYNSAPNPSYGYLGLIGINELFLFNSGCALGSFGGSACEWGILAGLGEISITGKYASLSQNFTSELFNPSGGIGIANQIEGGINYVIPTSPGISMGWSLVKKNYYNDSAQSQLKSLVSFSPNQFLINNEIDYNFDQANPYSGRWEIIYFPSAYRYRLSSEYDYLKVRSLEGEIQYNVGNLLSFSNVVHYQLDNRSTTLQLRGSRTFDSFNAGLNFGTQDLRDFNVGVLFGFSLLREPSTNSVHFSGKSLVLNGAASINVFIDRNRNGIFDKGDSPLPDIILVVNQNDGEATTDARGIAVLERLRPYMPTDISVSLRSLQDPFLRPARQGVRINSRPGTVSQVDLPMLIYGETDGVITFRESETPSKKGIELQLLDAAGNIKEKAKTDREGYYVFDSVPPGEYRLRLSPEDLKALKVTSTPEFHPIKILESGSFETNQDFVLAKEPNKLRLR